MAGRGTIYQGLDDGRGGNAAGLADIAGYCFDGCICRDPVIGSALGGAGGAGGAYVEAVGRNRSGMGAATGGAGGTSTSGGAGGGSYISGSCGRYGGAGGYSSAGDYSGAGAVTADCDDTGKRRTMKW